MLIPESAYYLRITAPLRAPEIRRNVAFGAEGFSYTSNTMAFVMTRVSKNHYDVKAIYNAKFEEYRYDSVGKAVEFSLKLIKLDRTKLMQEAL